MQFIDLEKQQERIEQKIKKRIDQVLSHGKYIMGPEVFELENLLADFVGVKHCITNSSGTDSLLMAGLALGIGKNDEVITTPLTWISTVEIIELLGAKTVFVDIDPHTYNIDHCLIENAITSKTKAIIPVSLYGQCSDMQVINSIAKKHNLFVIEDAAQSFGALHNKRRSCGLSTIGCTSFFPAKPLGCYGDGGACFTDDDDLAERMRWIRVHGQKTRHDVQCVGINGRMDTMQAAILLEKFAIFPEEIALREEVALRYNNAISDYVETPKLLDVNSSVYAQYTISCDDRQTIESKLKQNSIPYGVYYPKPAHLQPAYHHLGYKVGDFQVTETTVKNILSIPMHPYLTTEDISKVSNAIEQAITLGV